MDFALSADIEDFRARIARFVDERLIPLESDRAAYDAHENLAPDLLDACARQAKAEGLWALRMPRRARRAGACRWPGSRRATRR